MTETAATPDWLATAIDANQRRGLVTDLREEYPAETLPGDLCVVSPYDNAKAVGRLFLVTDSDPGRCTGLLVSAETELASEVDAILGPTETGLAYPIAAHTRFSGPIWTTQVRRRIGAVPADVLDQLLALAWSDEPTEVTVTRGMALLPEGIDPRYPALRALSAELDALTDCCRRRPDLAMSVLDPVLAELDVLRVVLSEPWEAAVAAAEATVDFLDRLLGSFDHLSRDEQQVARLFVERGLSNQPTATREIGPLITGHRDSAAVGRAVASVGNRSPVITVLSHQRCLTAVTSLAARVHDGATETTIVLTSISESCVLEAV